MLPDPQLGPIVPRRIVSEYETPGASEVQHVDRLLVVVIGGVWHHQGVLAIDVLVASALPGFRPARTGR